jgi:hypothetical protein
MSPGSADLVNSQKGLIQITNWIMSSFLLHLILQIHILHIFTPSMVLCDTHTAHFKKIRVKHLNCLKYSTFLKTYRYLLGLPLPCSSYYYSLWVNKKKGYKSLFFLNSIKLIFKWMIFPIESTFYVQFLVKVSKFYKTITLPGYAKTQRKKKNKLSVLSYKRKWWLQKGTWVTTECHQQTIQSQFICTVAKLTCCSFVGQQNQTFIQQRIHKHMFATHTVTGLSWTVNYFQHCKFVSGNSDDRSKLWVVS